MLVVAEREQLPVEQARAGSAVAWDALFKRYQLPLYAYAYELVHDEQDSLDIVQETFVNAARHIENLREDHKFGSWLFGIAHQKCVQRWRQENRQEKLLEQYADLLPENEENPRELLIHQEQQDGFMNLLNQLPLPQRSVLLLHFIEEFSLEEIAHITQTQLGTIKSRMHYAKKTLRNLLAGGRTS
jgi:RNA polymerase sigma-70 factor (ECF subfamily)